MNYRCVVAALALAGAAICFVQSGTAFAADAPAAKGAPAMTPPATSPPSSSPQAAYLAANLKKPGWKAAASGLQYRTVKALKDGPKPAPGSIVTVHYEGTFIDGSKFDSSYDRQEPATFQLANVIPGWQEGVPMMREGEIWEFAIPSSLAYGPDTRGPIPGGSTLLFKVRLLWVATPAPEPAKPAPAAAPAAPAAPAAK